MLNMVTTFYSITKNIVVNSRFITHRIFISLHLMPCMSLLQSGLVVIVSYLQTKVETDDNIAIADKIKKVGIIPIPIVGPTG